MCEEYHSVRPAMVRAGFTLVKKLVFCILPGYHNDVFMFDSRY